MAAFESEVVSYSIPATAGDHEISLVGSWTPVAVIVECNGADDVDSSTHWYCSLGAAAGATQWVYAHASRGAAGESRIYSGYSDAQVMMFFSPIDGSDNGSAALKSFGPGKITLTWTTPTAGVIGRKVRIIALGGDGLNAYAERVTLPGSTTTFDVTAGFQPTFGYVVGSARTGGTISATHHNMSVGVFDANASWCMAASVANAFDPTTTRSLLGTGAVMRLNATAGDTERVVVDSILSTGVRFEQEVSSVSGRSIGVLLLDPARTHVGVVDSPVTGDLVGGEAVKDVTLDADMVPRVLMTGTVWQTSLTASGAAGPVGVIFARGASDGTRQWAMHSIDQSAQTNTNAQGGGTQEAVIDVLDYARARVGRAPSATLVQAQASLTWDVVPASATKIGVVVLGAEALEAIEGTVDAVAPAAEVSASDSNEISGTADVTAPAATVSATGAPYTVHVPTGGVVLSGGPGLVQTVVGTAAPSAPAAEADASGSSTVTAEAAASAPAAEAAASGTSTVTGSAAAEAPPAEADASDSGSLSGEVAVDAPAAEADASGAPVVSGSAAAQAAAAEASAGGTPQVSGEAAVSASASEAAASGTSTITGSVDAQAPAARVAASDATDGTTGTADATAPAATVSAAGTSTVGGAAGVEAPAARAQAAGVSTITGSADVTAPAALVDAAEIPPVIPAAILLGGPITQRRITVGPITQRGQQAS